MLSAVKVVGSTLKVSVKPVEFAVPDVPPVCTALSKVTAVGGIVVSVYTTAVCGDPLMVNPLGLAIATDTVSPFPTVMLEIARVLVVPETLNAPLVAPVTVMLSAVKVVGSTLKVSVKPVEFAVPDVPPVCTALSKVTAVGVGSPPPFPPSSVIVMLQPIVSNKDAAISKPNKMFFFSFMDFPPKFIFPMLL
jgi:hypothetical protein